MGLLEQIEAELEGGDEGKGKDKDKKHSKMDGIVESVGLYGLDARVKHHLGRGEAIIFRKGLAEVTGRLKHAGYSSLGSTARNVVEMTKGAETFSFAEKNGRTIMVIGEAREVMKFLGPEPDKANPNPTPSVPKLAKMLGISAENANSALNMLKGGASPSTIASKVGLSVSKVNDLRKMCMDQGMMFENKGGDPPDDSFVANWMKDVDVNDLGAVLQSYVDAIVEMLPQYTLPMAHVLSSGSVRRSGNTTSVELSTNQGTLSIDLLPYGRSYGMVFTLVYPEGPSSMVSCRVIDLDNKSTLSAVMQRVSNVFHQQGLMFNELE